MPEPELIQHAGLDSAVYLRIYLLGGMADPTAVSGFCSWDQTGIKNISSARNFIKSFIQGFLPGIDLKIFLILLPTILMIMSKIEGFISVSALERKSAAKIPKTIGVSIPMKATFFINYIMVDGWAGIAAEIFRLKPLIMFHVVNFFFVKTEKDREKAMDPGSLDFHRCEPRIQFYFLLGLVYAVVTPFLLPFIVTFFGLAYFVFRHQIINVYNQEYESRHSGLMFCKGCYEPAFVIYPLQEHDGVLNEAVNAHFSEGDRNITQRAPVAASQNDFMEIDNPTRLEPGNLLYHFYLLVET
ncbi:hypothetical protein NE237_032136 [Protea cynaroides]|uniref:CSC1/OSCA1-like 7TM region domain-containing protein n=1 Tax=Protea cynaroides TaxID=273540 RepID=A0A9Q0R342_9MAGN|nr:hypothetical protein NE237_032136 [Protea cynaroides]